MKKINLKSSILALMMCVSTLQAETNYITFNSSNAPVHNHGARNQGHKRPSHNRKRHNPNAYYENAHYDAIHAHNEAIKTHNNININNTNVVHVDARLQEDKDLQFKKAARDLRNSHKEFQVAKREVNRCFLRFCLILGCRLFDFFICVLTFACKFVVQFVVFFVIFTLSFALASGKAGVCTCVHPTHTLLGFYLTI